MHEENCNMHCFTALNIHCSKAMHVAIFLVHRKQTSYYSGGPDAGRLPVRDRGVLLPVRHPALAARRRHHRPQLRPLLRLAQQEDGQAAQELQAAHLAGAEDVQETHGRRPLQAAPPNRAR